MIIDTWALPDQALAKMGTFEVSPGQHIAHWDTGGDGPALLLCHPYTGNLMSWPFQQPFFAKAGFRTIAYSRRGFAGSDPLNTDVPGTQGGDIAALLDHLAIDRVHIIGAAAGAWSALDFALAHPGRALSLISVCSLIAMREPDMAEALARIHPDWFKALPPEAKELSANFRLSHPKGVAWWKGVLAENPKPDGPRVSQPLSAPLSWDRLSGLDVRHLFIAGAADLYMPPNLAQIFAKRLPRTACHVIHSAAHTPFLETPEIFNDLCADFL